MTTSDSDMGYYLLLTIALSYHYLYFYLLIPPVIFGSPDSGNSATQRNWSTQFIYIMQNILRENLKYAGGIFFVYLSSLFELISQFQTNLTRVWNCQNVVFTAFFTQNNMNTKLWKITDWVLLLRKLPEHFCDTFVAALYQSELFYIGIKVLPTDKVHFHLGN